MWKALRDLLLVAVAVDADRCASVIGSRFRRLPKWSRRVLPPRPSRSDTRAYGRSTTVATPRWRSSHFSLHLSPRQADQPRLRQRTKIRARCVYRPRGGPVDSGQQVQQRGFAASRRPDDGDTLALGDGRATGLGTLQISKWVRGRSRTIEPTGSDDSVIDRVVLHDWTLWRAGAGRNAPLGEPIRP